jgi:hypothetical protein
MSIPTQPPMQPYRNLEGDQGAVSFAIGDDRITVRLHSGQELCFTYRSAGRAYVEHMKLLARAGDGLNRFMLNEAKGLHDPCTAP